jgi:hypothetical protein
MLFQPLAQARRIPKVRSTRAERVEGKGKVSDEGGGRVVRRCHMDDVSSRYERPRELTDSLYRTAGLRVGRGDNVKNLQRSIACRSDA